MSELNEAPKISPQANIHDTAIVGDGAKIGAETAIWHWSHVRGGATIGAGCTLGQNVYVAPTVVVGQGSKIQNNVSLFDGVVLEADVFCGPSAVFTNVTTPRAHVDRSDEFETTLVRQGATIGANATILCGLTIGRYALVGAGAVVTKEVRDFEVVVGNPARHLGWACRCGERLQTPAPIAVCERCGESYEALATGLRRCSREILS